MNSWWTFTFAGYRSLFAARAHGNCACAAQKHPDPYFELSGTILVQMAADSWNPFEAGPLIDLRWLRQRRCQRLNMLHQSIDSRL
jgi:hypothetical protein